MFKTTISILLLSLTISANGDNTKSTQGIDLNEVMRLLESAPAKHLSELRLAVSHDYLHLLDVGVESSSKEVLLQHASDHCVAAIRENKRSGNAYQTLSEILELQGKTAAAEKAQLHAINLGIEKSETPSFKALTA